jgi:hypothetical protein
MSVERFVRFMRDVNAGQSLHREDLGDEKSSVEGVLGGMSAASLRLAPQLQQQMGNAPIKKAEHTFAPPTPMAPGAKSMGGGSNGRMIRKPPQKPREDREE